MRQAWDKTTAKTRKPKEVINRIQSALKDPVAESEDRLVDERLLRASIYKESFYQFVRYLWDTVIPEKPTWNWHIEYLCDLIQEQAERVLAGLPKEHDTVINISPGSTKSTIISVMLPAWLWCRNPSMKFIGVSYTYPLAMDLSRKCRDVVTSDKYKEVFPYVELREDQNTKGYFATTKGGFRYCVGAGGSVTGMHGHMIVIDDPIDPNQTLSKQELIATNNWITQTLPSRKVDKRVTPTILVMQRLHTDDPTSVFLKRKNTKWVCLPAELTDKVNPPELAEKYVNGLMDPNRLSRQVLDDALEDMGGFGYSSQFLQDPKVLGGGLFKTDKVNFGIPPTEFKRITRAWDKAATADGGDWTVGTLIAIDLEDRVWVLDVVRWQYSTGKREREMVKIAEQDEEQYGQVPVIIEQEPGAGGKDSAEDSVRHLMGFVVNIQKVGGTKTGAGKVSGDKVQRAAPFSSQMNSGKVWVPENAPWFKTWADEFAYFPMTKYDDQVDSAATGFNAIARRKRRAGAIV